ncbi:hypothetical protein [Medusavirus stheno T3]|uniref:Transmembrane protein n=1 Tax=Medusavirus stheno T3 TaxID=3069717 RepID=A0A7S8BEU8_9VIRU|nr:hypothetical protein QKU73_gp247 [Acanthamoeba castellanii medusavirus]QPB44528.1 hypothetical protein [Medusavirus stheno T3]
MSSYEERQRKINYEMFKEFVVAGTVLAGTSFLTARGATMATRMLPPSHIAHRIGRSVAVEFAVGAMAIFSAAAFGVPTVAAVLGGTAWVMEGVHKRAERRVDNKERKE